MAFDIEREIIGKLDGIRVIYDCEQTARLEQLDGTGVYGIFRATNPNDGWQVAQFQSREKPCNFLNPKWTGN
jgi:hypothetical protein